jgi:hypothetical protein
MGKRQEGKKKPKSIKARTNMKMGSKRKLSRSVRALVSAEHQDN